MTKPKRKRKAPPATSAKRHTLHIRVEPSLADWIKRLAKHDRRTVNNWCERALTRACEQTARELARRDEDDVTAGGNPVRGSP